MADYKLEKMGQKELEFVESLINNEGIDPAEIDKDRNGTTGEISFEEAAAYALKSPDWEKYLPRLRAIDSRLKHPLDRSEFSPEVRERIHIAAIDAAARTEADEGITPGDPFYCHRLLTNFFDIGSRTYAEGGVCLKKSEDESPNYLGPELTAAEFFEACEKSAEKPAYMGSCTERTYARMSAVEEAATIPELNFNQCALDAVITENHVYPEHDGIPYDASNIGEIGWKRTVNAAGMYYDQRGVNKLAPIIDPAFHDRRLAEKLVGEGRLEEVLALFESKISSLPDSIWPFIKLLPDLMVRLRPEEAREFGLMILKKWPENPYAIRPLISLATSDEVTDVICERLETEMPETGWAETVRGGRYITKLIPEEAYVEFERALEKNPANPYAMNGIAGYYMERGALDRAEEMISASIALAPNLPGNHYLLALIHQTRGDLDAAFAKARKESTVFFGNINTLFLTAQLAGATGKIEEASLTLINLYKTLIKDPVRNRMQILNVLINLSQIFLLTGDTGAAWELLLKSVEVNGGTSVIHANLLAQIALFVNDFEAARGLIDEMDDTKLDTLGLRFFLLMNETDIEGAKGVYKRMKEQATDMQYLHHLAATIDLHEGRTEKAFEKYNGILSKNRYDIDAYTGTVYCQTLLGDTDSASEMLARLEKHYPLHYNVRSLRPILELKMGRFDKAIEDGIKLLEINPRDIDTLSIIASAYLGLKDYSSAYEIGELINKIAPALPWGEYIMAESLLGHGSFDEAMDLAASARSRLKKTHILWPLDGILNLPEAIETKKGLSQHIK